MGYKSDYARVHGLGAAGEGVTDWWRQRLSSIALIPLTLLFLFPFASALGEGHEAVLALYGDMRHALIAVLMIVVTFWHLAQGLQVVIEDYVPGKVARTALLLVNTFANFALGAAGVLAIATILFGA